MLVCFLSHSGSCHFLTKCLKESLHSWRPWKNPLDTEIWINSYAIKKEMSLSHRQGDWIRGGASHPPKCIAKQETAPPLFLPAFSYNRVGFRKKGSHFLLPCTQKSKLLSVCSVGIWHWQFCSLAVHVPLPRLKGLLFPLTASVIFTVRTYSFQACASSAMRGGKT